jgi:hypothetical protein
MIIEYRNLDNQKITSQKAFLTEEYSEVYIDEVSGLVKIEKIFSNKELLAINYYLDPSENELDKINEVRNLSDRFWITTREYYNGLLIEETKDFSNNAVLGFHSRNLHNNKGEVICREELDLNTQLPLYENTIKYLFNDSGDELLEATYNSDGSLEQITYKPDYYNEQDWESYDQTSFYELQSKFKEDLSYYLTATLESPLICKEIL